MMTGGVLFFFLGRIKFGGQELADAADSLRQSVACCKISSAEAFRHAKSIHSIYLPEEKAQRTHCCNSLISALYFECVLVSKAQIRDLMSKN